MIYKKYPEFTQSQGKDHTPKGCNVEEGGDPTNIKSMTSNYMEHNHSSSTKTIPRVSSITSRHGVEHYLLLFEGL